MNNNFSQPPFGSSFFSQTSSAFPSNNGNQPPADPFGFPTSANPSFQSSSHLPQPFASARFTAATASYPPSESDPFAPHSASAFALNPTSAPFPNDPFKTPQSEDFSQDTGGNNFATWNSGQPFTSSAFPGRRPFRGRDRDNSHALFLNNVPLELFSQEAIAEHFRVGFRGVTNVSLRGSADSRRTAVISFESPEDAAHALETCSHFNGAPLNVSIYMSYAQRAAAAAAAAAGPSSASLAPDPSSGRPNLATNRPPSQPNPPNRELVFSPVPKNLFSKEQIANLFSSICPNKVENVLIRERRSPNGSAKRTAIVIMVDVDSATAALENLPLYEGERLRVHYRAPRPVRPFPPPAPSGPREIGTPLQGDFGEAGSGSVPNSFVGDSHEEDGDLDMVGPAADQQEPGHEEEFMYSGGDELGFQYQPTENQSLEHWGQNATQAENPIDEPSEYDPEQREHTREEFTTPTPLPKHTPVKRNNRRSSGKVESSNAVPNNDQFQRPAPSKLVTAGTAVEEGEWREGEKIDLSQAKSIVGICRTMCPENEMKLRGMQEEFSRFEATDGRFDRSKAVKKYRRSAALSEAPKPEDIRPPDVLLRTMDHLRLICDENEDFAQIHLFVRDRTRSLRQDFTYQGVKDETCIQVHEEAVRFHILSEQLLSDLPLEVYSGAQNHEQLDKCLISLREMYDLRRDNELPTSPNEPEMQAYYMLLHMTDRKKFVQILSGFDRQVRESVPVQFAITVMSYAQQNSAGNPVLFFRCVADAPYLAACLLKRRFSFVRHSIIGDIASSFGTSQGPDSIPISTLTERLGTEDDSETLDLFRFLSFNVVSAAAAGSEMESHFVVLPDRAAQVDNIFKWKPGPARRLIDDKAEGMKPSQIIAGEGEFVTWGPIAFGSASPLKVRRTPPFSERQLLRLSMGEPPRAMLDKYGQSAKASRNASDGPPVPVDESNDVTDFPSGSVPEARLPYKQTTPAVTSEEDARSKGFSALVNTPPEKKVVDRDEPSQTPPVAFLQVAPVPNIQQSQFSEHPLWANPSFSLKPVPGSEMASAFFTAPNIGLNTGWQHPTHPSHNTAAVALPTTQTATTAPLTSSAVRNMVPSFPDSGTPGFVSMEERPTLFGSVAGGMTHELGIPEAHQRTQTKVESHGIDASEPLTAKSDQNTPETHKATSPSTPSAALAPPLNSPFPWPPSRPGQVVGDKPELTRDGPHISKDESADRADRDESDQIQPAPTDSPADASPKMNIQSSDECKAGSEPIFPPCAMEVEPRVEMPSLERSNLPPDSSRESELSVDHLEEVKTDSREKGKGDSAEKRRDLLLQIRDSANHNLAIIEKSVDKLRGRYIRFRDTYSQELVECDHLFTLLQEVGEVAQAAKDRSFRLDCDEEWVGESLSLFASTLNKIPMRQASLLWDEVSAFRALAELQQKRVELNVVFKKSRHLGVLRVDSIQLLPNLGREKPQILREHEVQTRDNFTSRWKRRPVTPEDLVSVSREMVNLKAMFWQGAVVNLSGDSRQANRWMQLRLSGWTLQSTGVMKVLRINDHDVDRYVSVVACEDENSVPASANYLGFTVDLVDGGDLRSYLPRVRKCLELMAQKNRDIKKSLPAVCVIVHDRSRNSESTRRTIQSLANTLDESLLEGLASKLGMVYVDKETIESLGKVEEVESIIIASAKVAKRHDFSQGIEPKLIPLEQTMVRRGEKAWKSILVYAKSSETECSGVLRVIAAVNKAWSCVGEELSQLVQRVPVEVGERRAAVVSARDAVIHYAKLPSPNDIGVTSPQEYLKWMEGYVGREESSMLDSEQEFDTLWKFCLALHRMIPTFLKKKLGEECFGSQVWTIVKNPPATDLEQQGLIEELFINQDRRYLGILKRSISGPGQASKRRRSCGDEGSQAKRLRFLQNDIGGRSDMDHQLADGSIRRRTMYAAYDSLVKECEAYQTLLDGTMAELQRRQRDAERRRRSEGNCTYDTRHGHSL